MTDTDVQARLAVLKHQMNGVLEAFKMLHENNVKRDNLIEDCILMVQDLYKIAGFDKADS